MFSREKTNTNFIVFGLTDQGLNPQSTSLDTSMLFITPASGVITLNLYVFFTIYHQFDVDIYHVVYVEIPVIIFTDETTVNSRNCENMGEKCGWELERC